MYLNCFFNSLELLRHPEYCDASLYPAYSEDIFYYGYEESTVGGNTVCGLYYFTTDNVLDMKRCDITKQWLYKETLKNEPVDLKNAISEKDASIVLDEAFRLYDAVICSGLPVIKLCGSAGINIIYDICVKAPEGGIDEPLRAFGNNVLLRDMLLEQVKYFVKKYIKSSPYYSPEKEKHFAQNLFNGMFAAALKEYYERPKSRGNRFENYKGNEELENFIRQLENNIL